MEICSHLAENGNFVPLKPVRLGKIMSLILMSHPVQDPPFQGRKCWTLARTSHFKEEEGFLKKQIKTWGGTLLKFLEKVVPSDISGPANITLIV